MVRKLAFVLVWIAAILPAGAQALGLGEIELNSFLNQPLDAKIEIISSRRGEMDSVEIQLASMSAFNRAGIEFNSLLPTIKFKLVRSKSDGTYFIKITTRKGYREPFLNFLLEVNWSSGRIIREYAALVDPPSLVQATPTQTFSPVRKSMPKPTTSSVIKSDDLFGAPDAPDTMIEVMTETKMVSRGVIGKTYTTKRHDTAWQIAKKLRADESVSVQQSMMAILRANPNAFIKQNINRLKAGYVLNIPDKESMLSQSKSAARAEVSEQTRTWQDQRSVVATTPKGHLEILPPKIASSSSDAMGSSVVSSEAANREVMRAKEVAVAQSQENAELRLRVSELEELIKNGRLEARLKSNKLTALEQQLRKLNEEKSAVPTKEMVEVMAGKTAAESMNEMQAEGSKSVAAEAPEVTEVMPKQTKVIVPAVPAAPGTPINQHQVEGFIPVDISSLPKSELLAKPFKTTAQEAAPIAMEKGLLDKVSAYFESNPLTLWIAIAAIGIFIVLIVVMVARSRRGNDQFEESILQDKSVSEDTFAATSTSVLAEKVEITEAEKFVETVEITEVVEEAMPEEEAGDTSFLNDMVFSDMNDLEGGSGESDPLTEADVFLAYGRFAPAEAMIKEAMAKEPDRNDLRLKLLEIFYSAKNKNDFENEAMAFNEYLADNPDADTWSKVVEMGDDLCPQHALFSGESTDTVASNDEDTAIMDFDLSEFEEQLDSLDAEEKSDAVDETANSDMDGLDLDLDLEALDVDDSGADDPTLEIANELEDLADVLNADDASLDVTQEIEIPDVVEPEQEDQMDLDDEALTDIDEVGTKLDLACAYIDMGDPEGAKSILDEVMEEGNDKQKGEAKTLMDKL